MPDKSQKRRNWSATTVSEKFKGRTIGEKTCKEWGTSRLIVQKIRASCFKEQSLESEASGYGEMNVQKYPFVLSIDGILVTSAEAVLARCGRDLVQRQESRRAK